MTVCGTEDPLLPLFLHPNWITLSMNYWPCSPDPLHYWGECQAWFADTERASGWVGWPCRRALSLMLWANQAVSAFHQASRQEACSRPSLSLESLERHHLGAGCASVCCLKVQDSCGSACRRGDRCKVPQKFFSWRESVKSNWKNVYLHPQNSKNVPMHTIH